MDGTQSASVFILPVSQLYERSFDNTKETSAKMADLNSMEFKSGQDFSSDRNMMALGVIKRQMTREERIKAKEREQAQKEGKVAPDLDAEGKEINPHVPQFIADAPWYMSGDTGGKSSLSHQKYVSNL